MSQRRRRAVFRDSGRKRPRSRIIDSDDEDEPPRQRQKFNHSSQSSQRSRPSQSRPNSQASGARTNSQKAAAFAITQDEVEHLVVKLMRLVLFFDAKKRVVKRADISQYVLTDKKYRNLTNKLIAIAQKRFRATMGFDFIELPQKEAGVKRKQNTTGVLKKKKTNASKVATGMYILRNGVGQKYRHWRPMAKEASQKTLSFTQPEREDMGLVMVILCLIYSNNQVMTQEDLFRHLSKMGFLDNRKHKVFGEWKKKITELVRKGYFARSKANRQDKEQTVWEFRIGQRSALEIGWPNILRATAQLFGEEPDPIAMKELMSSNTLEVGAEDLEDEEESGSPGSNRSINLA